MDKIKAIVGIDEVGRGPLAGPIMIGAVLVPHTFDYSRFAGIKDSKKLSAKKRQEWFEKINHLKKEGALNFFISSASADEIDSMGLSHCIKKIISTALKNLEADPLVTEVKLDGSLYAPPEFQFQKTIIKGDETEPIISAASIVAKVTRDRLMDGYALEYPEYGFEKHKGYGTDFHMKAIKLSGVTPIHRKSFLTRII